MTLSRRDFLRTTAAGTAVLTLPPAGLCTVLADNAKAPPSEQIRIGCIGVGRQGTGNMNKLIKSVVAVCDVDSTHLGTAKEAVEKATGKTCRAFGDFRKLLELKDVDAVVVTTPDHWHALPTIEACLAGKDVYCEKPLSLTIAEGRAMVKAARKNNRIVQTGSQQRSEYDGRFRLAAELVRNGKIGKLETVKVGLPNVNWTPPPVPDGDPPAELDYDFWLGPAPKRPYNEKRVHYLFRFFWDYSGGQMTNFGAHDLDITQWALGADDSGPVSAEAKARYQKDNWYEVPEWFEVTYTYANGVKVHCGQGKDYKGGCTFIGDKGTIYVNRSKIEVSPAEIKDSLTDKDLRLYKANGHHANWLECIKSRKLPICDVEIGHRSATVCHLGNIAVRSGRKVNWDPVKEEITGDSELAKMVSRPYRAPWRLPDLG
jgi:predicted dehydrogenase